MPSYETVRMRKDGSLLDVSLTVSPLKDARGKVIGASKIARDITEKRRKRRTPAIARERIEPSGEEYAGDRPVARGADISR